MNHFLIFLSSHFTTRQLANCSSLAGFRTRDLWSSVTMSRISRTLQICFARSNESDGWICTKQNEISPSALFVPPGRFSKVIAEKTLSKKVLGQPVEGNFIALHFPSNRGRCIFSLFWTFAFNDATNLGIALQILDREQWIDWDPFWNLHEDKFYELFRFLL